MGPPQGIHDRQLDKVETLTRRDCTGNPTRLPRLRVTRGDTFRIMRTTVFDW